MQLPELSAGGGFRKLSLLPEIVTKSHRALPARDIDITVQTYFLQDETMTWEKEASGSLPRRSGEVTPALRRYDPEQVKQAI